MINYSDHNNTSLSILTLNIRSIHCNFDLFLAFVSALQFSVDMFVLTECWTSENNPPPNIDSYDMFWTKNSINQNDGIVVYVREEIRARSCEPVFSEGNCLLINISPEYTVLCSYRPPCFRNTINYINALDKVLGNIHSKNIIFTGDININTFDDAGGQVQNYLNLMAMYGLRQGITKPTRLNNCLDHFMVKTSNTWQTVVFEQQLTDHSPILLYISNASINKSAMNYSKIIINYEQIRYDMKNVTWDSLLSTNDANMAAEIVTNTLLLTISKNTQIRLIQKKYKPLKPWISKGVIKSIRKRDRLHAHHKKIPSDERIKQRYLTYRNACNKLIKNLKRQYYQEKLAEKGDIRETWKIVKEVCNMNTKKEKLHELLNIKSSPVDSLNAVNSYFTTVGGTLANHMLGKFNKSERDLATMAETKKSPVNSMAFVPTDPQEVTSFVLGMRSHCSPGWDKITTDILKQNITSLAYPLSYLCNLSLETGTFPAIFKRAIVCPIYKSGAMDNPTNYRPISLLSTLSKLVEKVVNKRLVSYLEQNKLLGRNQFGFREGKSTEDAVLKLTSKLTALMDKGERCVGVFLDLQKAFDTVSTKILLARLQNVGIRGIVLDWFSDYLSERTQIIRVENYESDIGHCTFGVPQGSTLGPTLFLIYINDLFNITLPNVELLMFADDTVLVFHGKTWEIVRQEVEEGLAQITIWLENSLLSLNTSKTKYICFSKSYRMNPDPTFTVKIHTYPCNRTADRSNCSCDLLTRTPSIKYLGIVIDERLDWNTHTTMLAGRIRRMIYIFKNLRSVASFRLLIQTYRALCECLVRYCICAWGGTYKNHLIMVERAQRAVLKVIMRLPFRHPTANVYERANVLSVRKLFVLEMLVRYHKNVVPALPVTTKRINRCPVPRARTAFAGRHVDVIAPRIYNVFLNTNKDCKKYTVHKLKSTLTLWLNQYNYDEIENLISKKKK